MDTLYREISEYLFKEPSFSKVAYDTARLCLMDSIGCANLALQQKEALKFIGKETLKDLNPFEWGLLIRWLDYNDTWLAKEWGHPSDNIGTILHYGKELSFKEILEWIIRVYEIQGVLAMSASCNRNGFDHVYFVKIASGAVACALMGGDKAQVCDTLSQCFIDGAPLRTYRHGINTGSRKSWAAGDAAMRGATFAKFTMLGEKGYPNSISASHFGVQDVLFKDQKLELAKPLNDYVMSHILFKVLYPAEFHAQTAIEAAISLYPINLEKVEKITIKTHESALRIIDKKGPLKNPADRDHCLQYMVAVALLKGSLRVEDYEEPIDRRIDVLREKMEVVEEKSFSEDYHNQELRSIASSLQIFYTDGTTSKEITVEFPIGHLKRREEAKPLLYAKFEQNMSSRYSKEQIDGFLSFFNGTLEVPISKLLKRL